MNHHTLRLLLLCVLLALFGSTSLALDPNQPLSRLHHSTWTSRNGLDGAVDSLEQTADGFLWVGTTDGLYRYDGFMFERYKPEVGSFPGVAVSALLATRDGGLWIGFSQGGATFLKEGKATNYSEEDGFPVSQVRSFAQDFDGTIWADVIGGFTRLEGSRWQRIRMDWNYPSNAASTLFVDSQGTLWVGTSKKMMYLPRGERKFRDLGITAGHVFAFTQAPNGTLLFHDNNLDTLRAFRSPLDPRSGPLPQVNLAAREAIFDRDGALWIVGYGLQRIPFPDRLGDKKVAEGSPEVESFLEKDGLTNIEATAILEDREGNIWVGTTGGLERFRHRNLTWFPFPAGTSRYTLIAGNDGEVFVGSHGDKLRWPLSRVTDAKPVPGGPIDVLGAYRTAGGEIWIGAKKGVSLRWNGKEFIPIRPPDEAIKLLQSSQTADSILLSAVTKDHSGTMWVAYGGSGEFQLRDGVWKFIEILKEHPDWTPLFNFTDSKGRVWLSYPDRVAVVEEDKIRIFTSPADDTVAPFELIAEANQKIWIAGEKGLAYIDDNGFHTLKGMDGSAFGSVKGMVAPANDGLWLSATRGIIHIPNFEIERALRESTPKVNYEVFDLVSDLPASLQSDRIGLWGSGAIQGTDGMLWFAAQGGIARIDPSRVFRNSVPPPLAIRSVVADGHSYSTYTTANLPARTKSLEIRFTALSLTIPERVRFRYKLDGWDQEWHDVGSRREAFYTNLGPGNYVFRVAACNNDGVWNYDGAFLSFNVAPAWYQTRTFMVLCIVVSLFVLWTIYRLRMRQVARALAARFDERLAERTRLARELHDTFLQTIQGSKMVADDALDQPGDSVRMRKAMERLSEWLGQATEEGRAALHSLRTSTIEGNDLAEGLRRATEDGLVPGSMSINFSIVGDSKGMHPIVRDEIYRIGYEAIRNAVTHSQATRVDVELRYTQDISIRVRDNGIGIDPAVLAKGKNEHFGLQGMRERGDRIGGKLTINSSSTTGSEITIVVPGPIVFQQAKANPLESVKTILRKIRRTT